MLDSGVRIAAASLPVGIPVLVGLVVAVARRRALPGVAGPAIVGLLLQLLVVLVSTFLVVAASFNGFGMAPASFLSLSSVLGFAVIVLNVLSWTLLLVALFRRLPATRHDRVPTGRHALLDDQGEQVIAEEGTTLLPVGAAAGAGAGAGVGLGAAAAGSASTDSSLPLSGADAPGPVEEPAVTEVFATESVAADPGADAPALDDETDASREEPPAVTAESLDEAAETRDEAHADVADAAGEPDDAAGSRAEDPDEVPVDPESAETATLAIHGEQDDAGVDEAPADEAPADQVPADQVPADEAPADEAPAEGDSRAGLGAGSGTGTAVTAVTDVDDGISADEPALDTAAGHDDRDDHDGDEDGATVTDTLPAAGAPSGSTPGEASSSPTPPGGHPWFDPDGEQGTSPEADATRAGSTEGR